jgi:cytochrome c oxidase subunit II
MDQPREPFRFGGMLGIATLSPFSPQAHAISSIFVGILIFTFAIFVLVGGLITIIVIRFRERPNSIEPQPVFGSRVVEITWTAIPLVSLMIVFGFMTRTMHAADPPPGDHKADIEVIGHQWWWEANYLQSGVVVANEIHIPIDTPILVLVDSADVIHDFWVPELARKIDAVPGHPNYIWMQADRPGEYLGACAEFCGNEHAWMRIKVIAQTKEDYEAWQRGQLSVPATPPDGEAGQGAKLFVADTCVNCHTIVGTPANQRIGPDLTHIGSRTTLAAGAADNTPENLFHWLKDPDSIKPQSHMPNFQLSDSDAHALVAYLETLR